MGKKVEIRLAVRVESREQADSLLFVLGEALGEYESDDLAFKAAAQELADALATGYVLVNDEPVHTDDWSYVHSERDVWPS